MTSELFFEGKRYIPASEAAMIGGFTGDYISRLCRDGRLTARRVGKNWFVEQSSIEAFLVDQEYHRSKRSESLSRLRAEEYRAATREPLVAAPSSAAIQHVGKVRGESQQALKKGASALIAKMQDDIRAPSRALQLIPLSQGAGAPFVEAGQKLIALTLTMTIIFGVYATVDPKAASYSMREVRDDLAAGVQAPHGLARAVLAAETHEQHVLASITARPQVAAAGIPGYFSDAAAAFAKSVARSFSTNINEFVYAIAFPEALVSSQSVVPITRSGAVSLSIEPYARATSAAITRSVATSNALPPRAVAPSARPQQKIIERVVVEQAQTQQLAQAGGITEAELDMRLNQLDNKLTSQIYALTASQSTVIAQNYAVTAQTNAINQLTNTAIANPIITGGSIANASVGATSLSVSGNANVGGNLTVVGTASFGSYNIGSIVATSSTLVDLTASYSTTTNATTTNLFASNFTLGSSTGLLEANGGVVAATSTLSVGYGGVGTSTAPTYGQLLLGNGNGGYALVSTSSLGIASAVWGNITGMLSNQTDLQNALNAKLDLSAWYSTTTDQLAEGTNHLYFTTARANTNFANNLAATTTTALAEGSNLYFTTARAQNAISVSGSPLTYASGVIGINQANGSQSGFLSAGDWTAFNSKVSSTSLSATFPLAYNSATGVFSTSFSTTTNNTFSGTNTFNGALVGTGNTTLAAATSTSFAISSLSNALLSTNANGSVVATTSIGTNLLSGTLGIGQGGTNATSQTTNGVNYFNGTSITSGSNLTWNGTTFVLITPSSANAGNGIEMSSGATSTFLHINTSGSAYSPLVQQGDTQLILKGSAADSADTPGFVIAPWSGSLKGIRLDNNGNLGIGTANPAGAFETSNSYSGTSQGGEAYITNAYSSVSGTRVSDLTFRLTDSVGTKKNAAMIQALSNNQDSSTGDNLLFYTRTADAAPTEKMRLDNNGNLGIGTTIPVSNTNYGGLSLNGTSGGVFSLMTNGLETGRVQEDGNGLSINEIASLPIMLLTSDVERMRVLANGNVGIGTPTPQYNLEVHGQENVYSTTTPMTAATANQLTIREATNNPAYSLALGFFDNAGAYYSGVIQSTNAGSGSSLLLNPNGGNVGIGTTSPATKLDVFGSGGTPSLSTDNGLFQVGQTYNHLQIGADNNVPYEIWLQTKDSRNIGVSYPLSLNPLGGNVGIGTNNPASKLDVKGPDTSSTTLSFRVTDSSTNQLFAIDDSGVASVGNSSGTGDASAQFAADVNAWTIGYRSSDKAFVIASSTNLSSGAVLAIAKGGAATFSEGVVPNATNSYNLGVSGANWSCLYYNNSTLGTCASDERLKTDINDLSFDYASSTFGTASTTALEQVSQLRLRTFAYKTATSSIYEGLIAQEVLPIAPELVSTSSNGYYQLQYGSIQWLTLQALQELDANVNGIASGTTTASISPQAQSFVTNFFAGLFARLTNWFANANNGIDNLFAKNLYASNVTADTGTFGTLCVTDAAGKTCITRPQLDALLAAAGQASSGNAPTAAAGGNTSPGGITSSSTPPQLQVNGNNPATVNVGTAYADLGATITGPQGDTNLGISASVDGATSTPVSAISIDTSVAGTHTIRYSATDQQGQIGTATRTVQVVAPTAQQGSAGGGSSSVATSTASISGQAATTSAATSTAQ